MARILDIAVALARGKLPEEAPEIVSIPVERLDETSAVSPYIPSHT